MKPGKVPECHSRRSLVDAFRASFIWAQGFVEQGCESHPNDSEDRTRLWDCPHEDCVSQVFSKV